jgi:putative transposase
MATGPGCWRPRPGSGAADPKLRAGSFTSSLLERRRRVGQALFAVVVEAYLHGVSTPQGRRPGPGPWRRQRHQQERGQPDLRRPGRRGGRLPEPLPGRTEVPLCLRGRHLCKARVNRRVVAQAVVIATEVCSDGRREVLGFAVGDSEDGAFWAAFLRSLKARGLAGVQLVIADTHLGLHPDHLRPT